jgi:hypothetical protein
MLTPVTRNPEIDRRTRRAWGAALLLAVGLLWGGEDARAQSVSGTRGLSGGVGSIFSLTGPANLYTDSQSNVGYMYNFGNNFESFNFRLATGQVYSGGMMTLGPQLTIGLIQGANQTGSPLVFPRAPRLTTPLPPIQSSILPDSAFIDDTILP